MGPRVRFWMVIVAAMLVALLYLAPPSKEPFEESQKESIFVSVASYRDTECMTTLNDMFSKAKHPERIFVGICEQNSPQKNEQCVPLEFKYHDNVRKISIPNKEAKGPCYARYLCSTLFRGETYFMQIDSHTTFVKDWDVKAIQALKGCPSKKAVLSGYPHDTTVYTIDEESVPVLCDSEWNNDGLPQFKAVIKKKAEFKNGPLPIPFTSGGFVFAPGSIIRDVPYDPNLPHLFQGEEVLYSARAWTHGYDFFTAPVNIVLHKYYRKDEPKFWNDLSSWDAEQKKSAERARRILGLSKPVIRPGEDPHGLGNVRSIDEYWAFAGLDPKAKTSKSKEKFCHLPKTPSASA